MRMEHIECYFSKTMWIDGQEIPSNNQFRYLGPIVHHDCEIKEDVVHRIKTRWF